MSTAEKAFFSLTGMSQSNDKSSNGLTEREQRQKQLVNLRPVTLKIILERIENQDFDEELKDVLRKQVSRYPNQALQRFYDSFDKMVSIAQRKLKKSYVVEVEQVVLEAESVVQPVNIEQKQVFSPKKINLKDVASVELFDDEKIEVKKMMPANLAAKLVDTELE